MELTKKERLGFIYQLRILEALYPDEAADYARHRTALEEGYTLQYSWMAEHLDDELSEHDCREVIEVLDMYRAITFSVQNLEPDDEVRKHHLASFTGFDGNNETKQMSYARYFIVDLNRFDELKHDQYPYFNSHCPMLGTYRQMLERWAPIKNKFNLSREQLVTVLEVE